MKNLSNGVEKLQRTIQIIETDKMKIIDSENFHSVFNKNTGFFARWGKNLRDNPQVSPIGPEIVDVEISSGFCSGKCKFCYKSNGSGLAKNMSFFQFKDVISKLGPNLTQVALGLTDLNTNPDLTKIMRWCRSQNIIPNLTTNGFGFNKKLVKKVAGLAGAISVSYYEHTEGQAHNAICGLAEAGVKQLNIHLLLAKETFEYTQEFINWFSTSDIKNVVRALVFLGIKPKGRGFNLHPVSQTEFDKVVLACKTHKIQYGFDSCSAPKYEKHVKKYETENQKRLLQLSERCESGLFSIYINVDSRISPCSFCEGIFEPFDFKLEKDWSWWNHKRLNDWRKTLLKNNRKCPVYRLDK